MGLSQEAGQQGQDDQRGKHDGRDLTGPAAAQTPPNDHRLPWQQQQYRDTYHCMQTDDDCHRPAADQERTEAGEHRERQQQQQPQVRPSAGHT